VPLEKADEYVGLMKSVAIPDYRAVAGNKGAWCLHRRLGDRTEVKMLTFWTDYEAIAAFAGNPVDRARYYDFDPEFLLEMRETVDHFEIEDDRFIG
jgi:hypothetical protein